MLCHADAPDPRRRTRRSDRSPRIRRVGRPSPIADVQLLRRPDDGDSKHPTLSRRDAQNRPVTLTRQRRPRPRGRGERGRQNSYPANSQDLRTTHVDSSRTTERFWGSLAFGRPVERRPSGRGDAPGRTTKRQTPEGWPCPPCRCSGLPQPHRDHKSPPRTESVTPPPPISQTARRRELRMLSRDALAFVCSTPSGATVLSRGPCGKRGGELQGPSAESAAKALTYLVRTDTKKKARPPRRAF